MDPSPEVVASMPKVELHAHLNGSISEELLMHLKAFGENNAHDGNELPSLNSKGVLMDCLKRPNGVANSKDSKLATSLEECWVAFANIHKVIRTPSILYVATVNVIADFSRDNVVYLELRTGPKKIHNIPSKMIYVETVVKAIQDAQKQFPISVKLLISIDRKNGEKDALETIQLAKEIQKKYSNVLVGIDVSGDPKFGHASWIVPVMREARKEKLKISCHLSEIVNAEEGLAFMEFGPERVGHAQFLHPLYGGTEELWKLTKQRRIPIECCISSNLVTGVAASVDTHLVKILYQEALPFIICTDDFGVFKTTLSLEFKKMLSVVPLSLQELCDLSIDAVNYTFTTDEEKAILKNSIKNWWQKHLE